MEGESTLMSKLNSCSNIIQTLSSNVTNNHNCIGNSLILLDELGSGTDPESGSALAQAILEKILEANSQTRIVATTHSSQLKKLSFSMDDVDNRSEYTCASVVLKPKNHDHKDGLYQKPSYQLSYGTIGNSYAMGAASRCHPPLPDDVMKRASELLSNTLDNKNNRIGNSSSNDDGLIEVMTKSLEREMKRVQVSADVAELYQQQSLLCRNAMIDLAQSYEQKLSRIESRLDEILGKLMQEEGKGNMSGYEVVGQTVSELRLVKKQIKREEELLSQQGLKIPPYDYQFRSGESVIFLERDERTTATSTTSVVIAMDQSNASSGELAVNLPSSSFDDDSYWESMLTSTTTVERQQQPMIVRRQDIAIWDYSYMDDTDMNWGYDNSSSSRIKSVSDSKKQLYHKLSNINKTTDKKATVSTPSISEKDNESRNENKIFTSSRERKSAATAKKKNKRKRKNKRS